MRNPRAEAALPVGRYGPGAPAAEAYRRAVLLAQRIGDRDLEARLLCELACVCATTAPAEAIQHYSAALDLLADAGDRGGQAQALCGLGRSYLEAEQAADALKALERALACAVELGDERTELQARSLLADALAAEGLAAAAAVAAQETVPLAAGWATAAPSLQPCCTQRGDAGAPATPRLQQRTWKPRCPWPGRRETAGPNCRCW